MSGYITLALLTILVIYIVRRIAGRLRIPAPGAWGITVVFVLVTLTLWAEHFRKK